MRASIHANFLEQCRKPEKLNMVCQFCDMSSDKPGAGMRAYEWLIAQIEMLIEVGVRVLCLPAQPAEAEAGRPLPRLTAGDGRFAQVDTDDELVAPDDPASDQIDAACPEDADDELAAPEDPASEQIDAAAEEPANSGSS
eukprot:1814681-Pyramimonas_sp.AAC.1